MTRLERVPGHVRLGVPSNLPAELSTFVGRADDLQCGARLLGESRLVTFTGAGGCGKTRLARQVAVRVAERFPGGVWWVELASLADGALVTDQVARTLGLQAGETEAVADYFAERAALLLLDNCEHIVEGVAEFVTAVLRGAGLIRVLATSRHRLGVEGETTWRVPSLAVPPQAAYPATLDRFDAVRLFLERARQARPEVPLMAAVAQVCRRLDGIPLALELAAARVGGVAIDCLVDELDDRFRLLTGGSRAGLARHRTLLASVEWSYELLDPDERVLLRRLGVFVGGWTVEAARQVAGFAPLAPAGVLDLLGRLADKSLAQLDDSGRYWLLETIRAYARVRAAEAGETPTAAGRHLAWAADFAQRLEKDVERAAPECLDLVERELPNIRAALDHAAGAPDPDHNGLRLMTALAFFWTQRGYAAEGADYALRVLAGDPAAPPALRARARWAGAYDRFYTFDLDPATAEANTALEEARQAGDEATQGTVPARARRGHVHGRPRCEPPAVHLEPGTRQGQRGPLGRGGQPAVPGIQPPDATPAGPGGGAAGPVRGDGRPDGQRVPAGVAAYRVRYREGGCRRACGRGHRTADGHRHRAPRRRSRGRDLGLLMLGTGGVVARQRGRAACDRRRHGPPRPPAGGGGYDGARRAPADRRRHRSRGGRIVLPRRASAHQQRSARWRPDDSAGRHRRPARR